MKFIREDIYFEDPGRENTNDVIMAVKKRLNDVSVNYVIVASTTGDTALKLSDVLGDSVKIVSVSESAFMTEWGASYPCMNPDNKRELEKRGVIVAEKVPYLFHSSPLEGGKWSAPSPDMIIRETLYSFGQGMKVAVEVAMITVACGYIEPFQDVIAIGGSGRGADTAVLLRATFPTLIFAKDENKRLIIKEIIAMPRNK
ncbi:MAG: hypothetical protein ACPL7B_00795 [Candidatus Poribacteria bacterium]